METYKLYTEEDREAVRVVAEHRQRLRQAEAERIREMAQHREAYVCLEDEEEPLYFDADVEAAEPNRALAGRLMRGTARMVPAAVFALGAWEGLMDPWFALVCSVPYLAAGVWAALRG